LDSGGSHTPLRSNENAVVLPGEAAEVTVRVGAAAKFVEARSAKGAVSSIPPYEVRNGGRGCKHDADRDE